MTVNPRVIPLPSSTLTSPGTRPCVSRARAFLLYGAVLAVTGLVMGWSLRSVTLQLSSCGPGTDAYPALADCSLQQILWHQVALLGGGWLFLALVGLVALRRHLSLLAAKDHLREETRHRAEAQRRVEESAAELKIAAMAFDTHLGMFITDAEGRVLRTNPTFSRITGYAADEVKGRNPSMWASGRHDSTFYTEMWQTIAAEGSWQGEVWNRRKSGEVYPQWLTISAM